MESYKTRDMFIDDIEIGPTEGTGILDSMPTESTRVGDDPLYRYLSYDVREGSMQQLNMVTLTLKPEYHSLSTQEQYNMFKDVILGMDNENTSFYASFEYTRKGVLHVHMLVDWAFDIYKKNDMVRFKKLGFAYCTPIWDVNGSIAYISKDKHKMGDYVALYN